jgi:hypothetical protein
MSKLRVYGRAGVVAAFLFSFPLMLTPVAAQQGGAGATPAKTHSHPDRKFAACQKQANARKLHFEARRSFMRTCIGR